jgi:hypothetical protein
MKKSTLLSIVWFIIAWVITYAALAFVNLSWDSFLWVFGDRALLIMLCVVEVFLIFWIRHDENE